MKDPRILLEHILDSIERIEQYSSGLDFDAFSEQIETQDAIQKRFLVIGEAVKNIPDELKEKYKDIPWKDIASMRDFIVHEYFDVSLEQIWAAATEDIPKLKKVMLQMLKEQN